MDASGVLVPPAQLPPKVASLLVLPLQYFVLALCPNTLRLSFFQYLCSMCLAVHLPLAPYTLSLTSSRRAQMMEHALNLVIQATISRPMPQPATYVLDENIAEW